MNSTSPRYVLTTETATFLNIFVGALCAWTFVRLGAKIRKGGTDSVDSYILRALRRPENSAIPRGPEWLPPVAQDITALGSGANLTLAAGIVVGFLLLNRRIRAAGFLIASLGSGLLLSRCLRITSSEIGRPWFLI
jgi:undecaprenyl-diphosphatase